MPTLYYEIGIVGHHDARPAGDGRLMIGTYNIGYPYRYEQWTDDGDRDPVPWDYFEWGVLNASFTKFYSDDNATVTIGYPGGYQSARRKYGTANVEDGFVIPTEFGGGTAGPGGPSLPPNLPFSLELTPGGASSPLIWFDFGAKTAGGLSFASVKEAIHNKVIEAGEAALNQLGFGGFASAMRDAQTVDDFLRNMVNDGFDLLTYAFENFNDMDAAEFDMLAGKYLEETQQKSLEALRDIELFPGNPALEELADKILDGTRLIATGTRPYGDRIVASIEVQVGDISVAELSAEIDLEYSDGGSIVIAPGAQTQRIKTGNGNDRIVTNSGSQHISTGYGWDYVYAGDGDDTLRAGHEHESSLVSSNHYSGGDGTDTLDFTSQRIFTSAVPLEIDLMAGTAIRGSLLSDTFTSIENVVLADSAIAYGTNGDNVFYRGASAGNTIDGRGGVDTYVLRGNLSDFRVTHSGGEYSIARKSVGGVEVVDKVRGVELLQFDDILIDLRANPDASPDRSPDRSIDPVATKVAVRDIETHDFSGGLELLKGSRTALAGDTIVGSSPGDMVRLEGATSSALRIEGSTVTFAQTDIVFRPLTFSGDFSDGRFFAVTAPEGDATDLFFVRNLADAALVEGRPLAPAAVNGNAQPAAVFTGDGARTFRVTLSDKAKADHVNALGVYEIDPDGRMVDARLLFGDVQEAAGASAVIDRVESGNRLGFFIVEGGLGAGASLSFVNSARAPARIGDGNGVTLLVDGRIVDAEVFHAFSNSLNRDGLTHVRHGADPAGNGIRMAFEDLLGGGDNDFQDVVFSVNALDAGGDLLL